MNTLKHKKDGFKKTSSALLLLVVLLGATLTHPLFVHAAAQLAPTQLVAQDNQNISLYLNKVSADNQRIAQDSGNASALAIDQAQLKLDTDEVSYNQALLKYTQDNDAIIPASKATLQADQTSVNQLQTTTSADQSELTSLTQGQPVSSDPASASAQAASSLAAAAKTQSTAAASTATAAAENNPSRCTINPGTWSYCVLGWVASVALMFAGFAGFILGLIGSFLNWMVVVTIFQFGSYFGNSPGLLTAWGILRDIGNIVLICGFVYMGLLLILDVQATAARRAIPQFIIVALLLNFSLFAAEAVVDVSDVLSAALYNQAGAAGTGGTSQCASASTQDCATNVGISALILNATGLNDIFKSNDNFKTALSSIGPDPTHKLIVYVSLTIFLAVTAATLLAATILLIIRAVVLVFVLILAPIGFVAMVIPPFAGQGKRWLDTLLKQSFFAPVYLLLILVSLKIMLALQNTFTANNGGSSATILTTLASPNTSYGVIFIFFALVIGFMIAAQMTAGRMGAMGASFATGVANKAVRSTVLAPAKIAGRVGAVGGQYAYRNTLAPQLDKAGKGYATIAGKLRNSDNKFIKGAAGAFDNAFGASIEGGINAARDAKLPGTKGYQEKKDADEKRRIRTAHAANDSITFGNVDKALKDITAKQAAHAAGGPAVTPDDYETAHEAFGKLTQSQIETLAKDNKGLFNRLVAYENLNNGGGAIKEDIAKKLKDSDKLDHTQQHAVEGTLRITKLNSYDIKIKNGTYDPVVDGKRVAILVDNLGGEAADAKKRVLQTAAAAGAMSQKQLQGFVAKDKFDPTEAAALLARINAEYTTMINAARGTPEETKLKAKYSQMQKYVTGQRAKVFFNNAPLPDIP